MTQEEINKKILDNWDKEGLANGWVNEHIKNNELKQQVEYLQSKIDKAIEYYETHQQECVIGRNKDDKLIKEYYLPAQCSKKLYELLKEDK